MTAITNVLGVAVCELFQEDEMPAECREILERFKNDVLKTVMDVYKAYEE
ncbi:hypothetical protein FACS189498_1660 [Spirochaetia bacterium]|nr:hypothetical protein FACS189498_1660 [Spirochaetia bacterium]